MRHLFTKQFCRSYIVFSSFLTLLFFSCGNLFAVKYTTNGRVHQVDGPVEANDVNQKVLKIVLNVGTGGGGATLNSMSFNLAGNNEVAAAKLYFRNLVNDSTFSGAVQIGTTIFNPGSSITFSGLTAGNPTIGNWFYWLVIDAKATVTSGVIIDAALTDISGSTLPGFQNNGGAAPPFAPPIDPTGFRFTSRNYKIGTGEQYPTLLETANGISRFDYDGTDDIFMELTANYANPIENARITFSNHLGPATIIIRPQAGQTNKITAGVPGADLEFLLLNGMQKIILDGRPGGTGTAKEWTIRNTMTGTNVGPTVGFANDALNNTLNFLKIEGEVSTTVGPIGIIYFSNSSTLTGNDNNTISNCSITDLTSGGTSAFPFAGVSSFGFAGRANDGNIIFNNEIVDIFQPTRANSAYIYLGVNNDSWTISNNHFYQTASFSGLNTNPFSIINISSGGGYIISGNFIGGTAPNCGGTAYTISSGTAEFYAIVIGSAVSGTTVNINGNTISNMQYTTTMTSSVYPMGAVNLNGSANINFGTSGNGNLIGGNGGANNIILTNNSGSGSLGFIGIYQNASGTTSISYNTFSGIIVNGAKPAASSHLIQNFAGTTTVDNNTFGTFLNNISVSSNSDLFIIRNTAANGITCSNNTIDAISHNATTAGFGGIFNVAGNLTATGNTFQSISSSSNSSNGAFFMIDHEPSGAGVADIQSNTIQDINLTSTGTTVKFFGLSINTATSGNICSNNTIGNTINNNITLDNNAFNYAIYHSLGGSLTCNNNTIQEFNLTSAGTSASFSAINNASGAGTLSATGNIIKNIDCASSYAGLVLIGINNTSTATGNTFDNNTIINNNLTNTGVIGQWNLGIYCSTGNGSITKNFVSGLTMASTSASAEIDGVDVSAGNWDVFNNVVLLDNSPNTNSVNIYGIYLGGSGTIKAHHNTVKIDGVIATGAAGTSAIYSSNSGVKTIKNNIFQNKRTGTGVHAAFHLANTATLTTDYNFLEVANDQNQLCYYISDNTFAQWQANTGAINSINGTITLDASGKVSTDPFPGAGTGANLIATVTDDKLDVTRGIASWMGAYEGPNITTGIISPLSICAGGAIGVPYTVGGSGNFNGGNIFTAQLSNSAGDFSSPTAIGTLASTASGTIAATIPGGTPVGSGYRIRVVSSDPVVTGSDNGENINIQSAAPGVPTANAASGVNCSGFTANWATVASASTYYFDVATDAGFTSFVTGYNNLDVGNVISYAVTGLLAGTNYYYRIRAGNGCGTSGNSNAVGPVTTSGFQGTYAVTSTANGTTGDGVSLRWAITQANANCGHDIIRFNLGAGGPFTITLTSALPNLTDPDGVTIDGWNNGLNSGTPNTVQVFNATTTTPLNPVYKIILGNGGTVATGLVLASDNNIIQGLVLQDFGDGTPSANDIAITISGNNNKVLGCYIGIDATGTTRGTKTADGIVITGANNEIGDGTAAGANLISGMNGNYEGIWINGASATENTVKGNMIGLQKDGATIVTGAAQFSGIYINNSAVGNTIGGSNAGEGNVISGNNAANARGIYLNTSTAGGNTVIGNIIGLGADGMTNVAPNAQTFGIMISDSPDNIIGGNTSGARNIISGNATYGIDITGASSTGNIVKGNYIGIDKTGTAFITGSNQDYGVGLISTPSSNTIGGINAGEGNVISGNASYGIYVTSTAAPGNTILGNIIGPQADGISFLASNSQTYGIHVNGSPNNLIGGNSAGARNIISANETYGVLIIGANSTGNTVQGNYIGIDKNGTSFITGSTQDIGIGLVNTAASNIIGGSSNGEGNVISGNKDGSSTGRGIYFSASATGNFILGNIIGPQSDGVTYLASNGQYRGIEINGSLNNIIGGNTAGARNIISANEYDGVFITGAGSTGNVVKGNYIGIDKTGTSFITGSTQDIGVLINSTAASNTIGGSGAGEGNVISGNKGTSSTGTGIYLLSSAAAGNTIPGNIIGPQADGITYLASNAQFNGIYILNSPNNTIGGSTAGTRNTISANETSGIYISGASSTGNTVKGNYIGPSSSLINITTSSQDYGVYILSSAANNTIGATAAGEANEIAFNTVNGIYITDAATTGNKISANPVYSNAGKPINLNYGPSQGNNGKIIPVITSANATAVSGTSDATDDIEVFKNTTGDCFDAATYIGSATAVGGAWSLTGLSLSAGEYVLATARDGSNNTSEFSSCSEVIVDLYWIGGNGAWNNPANWSYSSGGAACSCIPDIYSNVFIDNNSGAVTITIPSGTWYTKGFFMSGAGSKASIVGQGSLMPRP